MGPELAGELTIPGPGASVVRGLVSEGLGRLLRALPGLPVPGELRAGHAALLQALQVGLRERPGAVWSALRRSTVGTLIRCARARPDLVIQLDATLAVELAVSGAPAPVVVAAPSRVVSLGARRSFTLGPGSLRCVAGAVHHRDPAGRERRVWSAEAGGGEPSHVELANGVALALVDDNPLAQVEAHPDKQGNALELGGQPVASWVAGLRAGLDLVGTHLPALREEIGALLQQVVPVGYDEARQVSASYQEAIGTVYLSLHPQARSTAEALIHECSHLKLYALLERGPLLENAFAPLYPSPVRPDPRPLHGVLLAVHAFLPVARLYERWLAREESPQLRARYREVVAGNREAAATLRAHARPTALGAGLLAEIDRWDRHFAGGV